MQALIKVVTIGDFHECCDFDLVVKDEIEDSLIINPFRLDKGWEENFGSRRWSG
jgi:hypothetical protein